jgi:hypothetical protein
VSQAAIAATVAAAIEVFLRNVLREVASVGMSEIRKR